MIDSYPIGPIDLTNQKEPFKKFFTLFNSTLQQAGGQGIDHYVLFVLAQEAVTKGIIPMPFHEQFRQAIAKRRAPALQSLLYQIQGYYAGQPA